MQLHFTGKNIVMTDALKAFITDKFQPLHKRYSHITNVYVVLLVEKADQIAEATVHMSGTELHATAKSHDMYKSIEELANKLLGQITKFKEKTTEHHR